MRRTSRLAAPARPAIVAAARRLFAQRGFAGTSMREIAAAAGVSKAAIYHHFRDKDRLYRTLLGEAVRTLTAAMSRVFDDGPASVQLARMVVLRLQFASDHSDLLRMLMQEQLRGGPRRGRTWNAIVRNREEELALFEKVLERGIARGEFKPVDPALSAQALAAALQVLTAGFLTATPPVEVAEVTQNVLDVLLNGLAARPLPQVEIAELLNAKEPTT